MELVEGAIGAVIVLAILFDVFQTVVLPRPTPAAFRPSSAVIALLWGATSWLAQRTRNPGRRELLLGTFATFVVVLLLVTWVVALVVGYGLVLHSLHSEIHPAAPDLGDAICFSDVSLLTVGFGAYQRRETLVISLSARAGAPPLGVMLLEMYAKYGMQADLGAVFVALRSEYAGTLNAMAKHWATPPALRIGDRSRLHPHVRQAVRMVGGPARPGL